MTIRPVSGALCITAALSSAALFAQRDPNDPVSERHPAIEYRTRPTTDPVAELNRRIVAGELQLAHEPTNGYLRSVLQVLKIPTESQMLVFSETSLQSEFITRESPRALYFNDTATVGWVKGADALELTAWDPEQGVVFYVLDQAPTTKPHFSRSQRCLECHESPTTLGIPGLLTMSMLPLSDDPNEYAVGWSVDQRTPIEDRWGGWFVTGSAVPRRHLGNVPVYHVKKGGVRAPAAPTLTAVTGTIDVAPYPAPYSDVAALLAFNHQTHMTNLIIRLNWTARVDDHDRAAGRGALRKAATGEPEADPVERVASELVDYMLFIDEAPLPAPVKGNAGFAEQFAAAGPRDAKGRTLRELDLTKRLLKYPCSYMIYAPAFDALPPRAKTAVYTRLWDVLSGKDANKDYQRLSPSDRQAIIEILRDTKKDLPASFR